MFKLLRKHGVKSASLGGAQRTMFLIKRPDTGDQVKMKSTLDFVTYKNGSRPMYGVHSHLLVDNTLYLADIKAIALA